MGSRNGTTLGGIPLGGRVPLPEDGVLGLGDGSEVSFTRDPWLSLEVRTGRDIGARALYLPGTARLCDLIPGAPDLAIRFERGRPVVEGEGAFTLNGEPARGVIQLVAGDTLEAAGAQVSAEA